MGGQGRTIPLRVEAACKRLAVLLFCLFGVTSTVTAQSPEDARLPARPLPFELLQLVPESGVLVISSEQILEVETWIRDFAKWHEAAERWVDRRSRRSTWEEFVDGNRK